MKVHHRPTLFTPYFDDRHPTGLSPQFLDLYESSDRPERKALLEDQDPDLSVTNALGTISEFGGKSVAEHPQFYTHEIDTIKGEFHPPTLFHTRPETVTVDEAFFDEKMSTTLPTMGMIVKNDFPTATMRASDDLSAHSSRLAVHASNLGLIEGHPANPDFDQRNQIQRVTGGYTRPVHQQDVSGEMGRMGFEEIPQTEVDTARSQVRETLRGKKEKSKVTPRHLHPTLFSVLNDYD